MRKMNIAAFILPCVFVGVAFSQSRGPAQHRQLSVTEVVSRSRAAVVQIVISDQAGKEIALGSGFLVSADGKIVTNYHVIDAAHSAVAKMADGSFFPVAGVLEADRDKDLAVLKVDGKGLPFLMIASGLGLHVGDHVVAIGSPLGLEGSVSDGIVSALREEAPGREWIQTTAPVSHGNSGGPLLNMEGSVVGVITWGVNTEQGQNLNFAIPSDVVKSVLSMSTEMLPLESVVNSHQPPASQPTEASSSATDTHENESGTIHKDVGDSAVGSKSAQSPANENGENSAESASAKPAEATSKAAIEPQNSTSSPDQQVKERLEKEKRSSEQAARDETAGLTWTDPATGLVWTKKDNDFDVDWNGAERICRDLDLGGHTDWRLPTIDELAGTYDKMEHFHGHHIKGRIRLTGCYSCLENLWSITPTSTYGEARLFNFDLGQRFSFPKYEDHGARALCVRGAGE